MANVKLKQLKIEKYRNVAPGTVLDFNDGINVLLGQNGTGKTTLLNLIAMVTASRFGSLKETEFSIAYTLDLAGEGVDVAIENKRVESPQEFDEPFVWTYRVVLRTDGLPDTWTVRGTMKEMLVHTGERSNDAHSFAAANPFDRPLLASPLLSVLRLLSKEHQAQYGHPIWALLEFESRNARNGRRFDELLGGLDSIIGASNSNDVPASSVQSFRYVKDFAPRQRDLSIFIPGQLELMMKEHEPAPGSLDDVVVKPEDVDFLGKAVQLMGFKGAKMLLRLRRRDPVEGGERLTFGSFAFTLTVDDETVISHEELSFGQKRILSFLYYVAANDDVVVADEIVNGMHYAWIEACLRQIGDRQAFLTSQNPLLLDFLPFTSEKDVEHTFILCGHEPGEGRRQMTWRNMPEDSAHTFFRSYKTQALQVSEILRSRGWW